MVVCVCVSVCVWVGGWCVCVNLELLDMICYLGDMLSVDIGGDANLELVDKFCYLSDMLSVDRDDDAAMETRIRIG